MIPLLSHVDFKSSVTWHKRRMKMILLQTSKGTLLISPNYMEWSIKRAAILTILQKEIT